MDLFLFKKQEKYRQTIYQPNRYNRDDFIRKKGQNDGNSNHGDGRQDFL